MKLYYYLSCNMVTKTYIGPAEDLTCMIYSASDLKYREIAADMHGTIEIGASDREAWGSW